MELNELHNAASEYSGNQPHLFGAFRAGAIWRDSKDKELTEFNIKALKSIIELCQATILLIELKQ